MASTDFVRQLLVDSLDKSDRSMHTDEVSPTPKVSIFNVLSRNQLETLIENVSSTDDISIRENLAFKIHLEGVRDVFKQKHNIALRPPLSRTKKRKLKSGQLALLSRSDLEEFAKSS